MEKSIGTCYKSSPFIQNLLKKQICSFEILWQKYPPIFSQICHSTDLLKSACRIPPLVKGIVGNSAIVISTRHWEKSVEETNM